MSLTLRKIISEFGIFGLFRIPLILLSIIPILISVLNNSVQTPTEALEAYKDGCCFDKNTQIKTKYGNKPISE